MKLVTAGKIRHRIAFAILVITFIIMLADRRTSACGVQQNIKNQLRHAGIHTMKQHATFSTADSAILANTMPQVK